MLSSCNAKEGLVKPASHQVAATLRCTMWLQHALNVNCNAEHSLCRDQSLCVRKMAAHIPAPKPVQGSLL